MSTFLSGQSTSSSSSKTKGSKQRGKYTPSSGMLKTRTRKKTIRLLTKKIARWEANKLAGKKANVGRKGEHSKKPQRLGGKVANRNTWNTEGLKRALDLLKT